jgi:superfamily II DNA or RNA helicase
MERFAARSVSIETAIDAMQQRDLKKLKMLSVWVQKRDKTVLLTPDDLSSLELAIECLEQKLSQDERSAALDEIKSGKLKAAAREVCIEEAE